jgi:hypothetical protein
VRSIADGSVRWRAPVEHDPWLGAPPIAQSLDTDRSLWPASAVILRTPPEGERYEVRRLDTEDLPISDRLRLLDPRTGKLTEHAVGKLYSNNSRAVPADGPEITAVTATAGVTPRVPVLWSQFDEKVSVSGRILRTGRVGTRGVAATATQVGWERDVHVFAGGDRDGVEVHDRRTGKRLVRFAAEKRAYLHSEGERLVITADGRDYVVKP